MANKWLLSLLLLISITNLFWTNAEVTSCYTGSKSKENSDASYVVTQDCSDAKNYGCYRWETDEDISVGCADGESCTSNYPMEGFYSCCLEENNCNKP